jgi:hypothetical protein
MINVKGLHKIFDKSELEQISPYETLDEIMESRLSKELKIQCCLAFMEEKKLCEYIVWCIMLSNIETFLSVEFSFVNGEIKSSADNIRGLARACDNEILFGRWTKDGCSDKELNKRKIKKLNEVRR